MYAGTRGCDDQCRQDTYVHGPEAMSMRCKQADLDDPLLYDCYHVGLLLGAQHILMQLQPCRPTTPSATMIPCSNSTTQILGSKQYARCAMEGLVWNAE